MIDSDLLANLLATDSFAEQLILLETADLTQESGVAQLLDHARSLIRTNPGQAGQLAALSSTLATHIGALTHVPPAAYLQAQAHALNGQLSQAANLITAAHTGYATLGDQEAALRTNVGLMNILGEMGRYEEALAAGQEILDAVNGSNPQLTALAQQNRGICLERTGQYEAALAAYSEAEAHYEALDMQDNLGQLLSNRGLLLLSLGRGQEALAAFTAAADIHQAQGSDFAHARMLTNIGEAQLLLGNYQQGLDSLEQAHQFFSTQEALAEQSVLLLERAKGYLALNLYPQALSAYREVESILHTAGMAYHRAHALWGMGAALIAQQSFAEAENVLQRASEAFAASGNKALQSSIMLEQAALQAARGERGRALQQVQAAIDLIADEDWPVQQLYAQLRLVDLLLPDVAAAERHLATAAQLAERIGLPQLRYRTAQRLGHVRLLQQRYDEAQTALETAVSTIEQLRGNLAQETLRLSFLSDKTAAYEDLIQLYLLRGDAHSREQAFTIAEQAKSRTLVDLLAGLIAVQPPETADSALAARLQELQADLNTIYNEVLGQQDNHERRPRILGNLNQQAYALEQEISRLRLRLPQQANISAALDSAQFVPPRILNPSNLAPDITMLAYHIVGEEILAFVRRRGDGGRLQAVRGLSTVTAVARQLQRLNTQWERFRAGTAFVSRHQIQLERSAQAVLHALYQMLIAPVEPYLPATNNQQPAKLLIIPHGLLHQLPIHALFDGRDYLLDRFEIAYAPSATVFHLCQRRPIPSSGQATIFGVSDPSIPHVISETKAIASHLDNAQLFVDEDATTAVLQAHAPRSRLLHLACHGLFRSGNPMFSALKLHDAWFTANDVLALQLRNTLVTLSACESGRNQILGGDEILGLTRAFLGAGAAALAVSLWLVEDKTTADLMTHWYHNMPQQSYAAALRAAQLAVKNDHPHPYYWAPFIFVGRF